MPALDKSCRVRLMTNPKVATTVAKLQREADAAVVQERIASREEVLQTLTGYMHSGEPGDSVKLRAAELMGKALRAVHRPYRGCEAASFLRGNTA